MSRTKTFLLDVDDQSYVEPVELELLWQGVYDDGNSDKAIVEVWREGASFRFRVPKYPVRSEVWDDDIKWWGGLYDTEKEAREQGCARAKIAENSLTQEDFSRSGKKCLYPPQ